MSPVAVIALVIVLGLLALVALRVLISIAMALFWPLLILGVGVMVGLLLASRRRSA